MRRRWNVRILLAVSLLTVAPKIVWAEHAEPPLPPILLNLQSRGAHGMGECYAEENAGRPGAPPGFTQRLQETFPLGSNQETLINMLTKQGFGKPSACKSDPSIHSMGFSQHRVKDGGFSEWLFSLTYTAHATVYWKASPANTIVWIKGIIGYEGL